MLIRALVCVFAVLLTSCTTIPTATTRYLDENMIRQLHIGVSTPAQTQVVLGAPSFAKANPDGTHMYFYDLSSTKVLSLLFNQQGLLAKTATWNSQGACEL